MESQLALRKEIQDLKAKLVEFEGDAKAVQLLRSIASNSPSNIMLLDLNGRIQYINHTVPGITPEQLLGVRLIDLVDVEFRPGILGALRRAASTGNPDKYETAYTSPSGDYSWWDSRVAPVLDGPIVTSYVVVSTNVTEERRKNEEQERFFNLSVDLMCVAGFDGYFKHVNKAFVETLGVGEEIMKRPYMDFIHPDDIQATIEISRQIANGGMGRIFINRYRTADGSYRLLSWQGIADPKREVFYGVARDITDTRHLEEELQQARRMEALGQLAGGIAHDFNNLLTAIQGNVELARFSPEDAESALLDAQDAIARASSLTKQLLLFSKNRPLNTVPVNLKLVLDNIMMLLKRLLPENIQLSTTNVPELPLVLADQSQLEQVIVNLCVNARDAMPDGGTLKVQLEEVTIVPGATGTTASPGRYVLLSVADTGCGMPAEVQARIFDPFFTTKDPGKGTGLGLATVYAIVKQHAGFIDVVSSPGKGSCFRLYLPIKDLPHDHSSSSEPEEAPPKGGTETILLAEDETMVRNVVSRLLRKAGYKVLEARDGVEATALYEKHRSAIGLVLLDVVMPNRGGLETAALLRQYNPAIDIIFASGHVQSNQDLIRLKSEMFLQKPYQYEELLRMIRTALDSRFYA